MMLMGVIFLFVSFGAFSSGSMLFGTIALIIGAFLMFAAYGASLPDQIPLPTSREESRPTKTIRKQTFTNQVFDLNLASQSDFIAIDFETATEKRSSACAMALAYVKGDRIIGTYSSLICPPDNQYSHHNISIHGIYPEHTMSAPNFLDIWTDSLKHIVEKGIDLVAHNASFDMSVLRNSLQHYGINVPFIDAHCTVDKAKDLLPHLSNYKLPTVADRLNIDLDHHDPLSDAIASAKIMIAWRKYSGIKPVKYWDEQRMVPTPANLLINYRKKIGEETEREIVVKEYDGTEYLNAFCKLRGMNRTFIIEKIQSCIDLDTGESIDDIPGLLKSKYLASVYYAIDKALEKGKDILSVLFYVGKSDGQLRAPERAILRDAIKKMVKDDRVTDEITDSIINNLDILSLHAFKLAVGRIAKANKNNLITVKMLSQKIIQTQKSVSTGEQEALDYIEKVIARN